MNKLKNTYCYLAGNLEHTDDAENWRNDFAAELRTIGVNVLDPTKQMFQEQICENEEIRNCFKQMRKNHEFSQLHDIMKNIIRRDLRAVDLSTFLIVRLEPFKATWGTTHEIIQASIQRKPILFLIDKKEDMPLWLIGLVNMDFVFETKKDLFQTLFDLDCGKTDMDVKYWKILSI